MKLKTTTQHHQFSKLSDEVKAGIVDEVVRWGLTIWHSTAEDLRGYWLEKKSYETDLYLLRSEDGTLVGSATFKLYEVNYEGKTIDIVKLGLGVDPRYRGNKFALRCMMSEIFRLKAAHPIRPLYVFSTLIHPVTYKLCCDSLSDRLYPHFKHPENPEMQKMVEYLAELFGLEKADSPHPFVYKERFSAIETQEAIDYWRNNPRPDVRFFVEHCPNYYCSGDCLIVLSPVLLTSLVALSVRTLVRNRVDRWRGRKARFTS
jgi:hypothetical protein